jgi:transcription antitermination factor NusG
MTSQNIAGDQQWFAMRVRTNCEWSTSRALALRAIESFLPTYREARIWSDRIKQICQPLFPGYLFCRLSPMARSFALMTPGAMSFVGSGSIPIAIPEPEIESLKILVSSLHVKPWPFLELGQKVRVEKGPLAGVEGILESFRNGYRIVVSITLLQRSVAAELDRDWVVPLSHATNRLPKSSQPLIIPSNQSR